MKHLVKYIALIVIAISLFSCIKETQQKMVGKWKLYVVPAKAYNEVWTFTETDVTRTYEYTDTTVIQNSGTYELKTASTFTITGPNSTMKGVDYFKGTWTIKDIDSKGMVIYRQDAGTIYDEFEKQ